jgi:signal transduction histidine kinase
VILALWAAVVLAGGTVATARNTNLLEISSVAVNGKSLRWKPGKELNLGAFPKNIIFGFGRVGEAVQRPLRLRTKLEAYDSQWDDGGGEMSVTIRFYNAAGDRVGDKRFAVRGESPGWNGSLDSSALVRRRETLSAPPDAAHLWVIISSASGPTTTGIYVVDNLIVSRLSASNSQPEVLLRSPFGHRSENDSTNQAAEGWERDGLRPSMAKIVEIGGREETKALAVQDDDLFSHAEWHNTKETAPAVTPNENLLVEWNEMFSVGLGDNHFAHYDKLPPGSYRFRVTEATVFGKPTGEEATLAIVVPMPYWQTPLFWAALAVVTAAVSALSVRYVAWQRMQRTMLRLSQQRALEQERLRIAQDIHDDLGARVTEISLLSAMAHSNPSFSEQARGEFDRISHLSRDLVSALYETVWAVNPENDNVDAVGNYLCQRINKQCLQAGLRCRLHASQLPRHIVISSRLRHNLSLAAKEAMHNTIKHARASQVTVRVAFQEMTLTLTIQDDGCGFEPESRFDGHGLANMKRRMEDIGGTCLVVSSPGNGTTIQFRLVVKPAGGTSQENWPPERGEASPELRQYKEQLTYAKISRSGGR